MDAAQWSQQQVAASLGMPMDEITSTTPPNNNQNNNNPTSNASRAATQELERRTRPQKDQAINCPRCNSTNTKFCYYNNYSLTQPRYFCKTCRRYWTQGGSLRNVPVGGGSRKNKRSSSSSPSILTSPSSTSTNSTPTIHTKLIPDLNPPTSLSHLITASHQNPNKFLEGQDLNLAFPIQGLFHHHLDHHHHHHNLPKMEGSNNNNNENHEPSINMNGNISTNPCTTTTSTTTCLVGGGNNNNNSGPISALELLRSGIASRGGLNTLVPMPMHDTNTLYQSGYPHLQEFKPNMTFFSSPTHEHNTLVGSGDQGNNNTNKTTGGARLLFPFADMNKLAATSTPPANTQHHEIVDDQSNKAGNDHHHHNQHHHHHHHQAPTPGYWSGMLGGGTW